MTILIAYDGSDDSKTAVERAAGLLRPVPAVVLTVWEPLLMQLARTTLVAPGPLIDGNDMELQKEQQEQAAQTAEEGADIARRAGLPDAVARSEATSGPIWSTIVDVAADIEATLLVTGTRGLGRAKSVLLGSVSDRILHHAGRPVLIIRHDDD
ncbi:universal stress protein [Actinomadura barringtoniae]|uniref:Universal stress protein n=1 Tax=Actinomadura barringtoniae TaxID=1427535 RepID=A0A939TCR4_9ACTN|nr:universal stress protein [Actinomadura barringtoniae]MBO2454837.1 universal stress protein [Actinomadura barringtoniae]